jgi:acyl-ACP thioesterase
VPELNDTADITEWIRQARKLFGSMKKQLLSNKRILIDIRRTFYQVIVVNIVL